MKLTGLHLLVTYQCTSECDHCFVWGSPWQTGTLTLANIRDVLRQARDLGTIEWIYYEGGEPFLYYPILLDGVRLANQLGFRVGLVSNCYWATAAEDAIQWLKPFMGQVQDLSLSADVYHGGEECDPLVENVRAAAESLGIPVGVIRTEAPEQAGGQSQVGQLPVGVATVMYRGRAAEKLASRAPRRPWRNFNACPHEDLGNPARLHLDPLGNVHVCQGIVLGNLFRTPLQEICNTYDPYSHPIVGALHAGGPAELVRRYGLATRRSFADACHLCDHARRVLRSRFPGILMPDQMYGLPESPRTCSPE
jgi:MoaA/NifB/PqqE/SkfB family radical SAM enzyme